MNVRSPDPALWLLGVLVWVSTVSALCLMPLSGAVLSLEFSDKLGHVTLFALGAFWLTFRQAPALSRNLPWLLLMVLFGAYIEACQGLTTYRSAEALDLVADALGVSLGWSLQVLMQRNGLISYTDHPMTKIG